MSDFFKEWKSSVEMANSLERIAVELMGFYHQSKTTIPLSREAHNWWEERKLFVDARITNTAPSYMEKTIAEYVAHLNERISLERMEEIERRTGIVDELRTRIYALEKKLLQDDE